MIHADGIDGVFPDEEDADALVRVIQTFAPAADSESDNRPV
jgi:hypothetical protein